LVVRNVADLADAPSQDKNPATILTAAQAKQLFDVVREDRLYPLYICAVTLGLREGELLALTWDDVDFVNRRIRINKQLQYIPGQGLSVKRPKTKTSIRTLPLPDMTYQVLKDYQKPNGLIFSTGVGTYFSPRNILRHFHQTLKKMDLPIMPFHNLRHSCGRPFGRLVNASEDATRGQKRVFSPWRFSTPSGAGLVSFQGTRASCTG